jgi:hypothetical protein
MSEVFLMVVQMAKKKDVHLVCKKDTQLDDPEDVEKVKQKDTTRADEKAHKKEHSKAPCSAFH